VKGFLIPGSTSDGWELNDEEFRQLLEIALEQTQKLERYLLIGVLKVEAREALEKIIDLKNDIISRTGELDAEKALIKARVCGFTICAPRGREVTRGEMERGLSSILETGLPIALYQLPQITENEIDPDLIAQLAEQFSNFIFFKDSSGTDRLMLSGKDLGGVFTMRGAEGQYVDWTKAAGGGYDGFLLSTANCLAAEFNQIFGHLAAKRGKAARELSDRATALISGVFEVVKPWPDGNAFSNANKAMDHFFAFGPSTVDLPGPRLHGGSRLPGEMIRKTGELLHRHGLMPGRGYS